jgi:uncharacterized protein (TIGR02599 family)
MRLAALSIMRSCCRIPDPARSAKGGFTLLEACAALFILVLVFGMLEQFMAGVTQAWQTGASDPFSEAATAFETVTQSLSRATLEPYRDYADASGAFRSGSGAGFVPDHPARRSDLAFACGPSTGPGGLLASSGRTTATGSVFFMQAAGQTQLYAQDGLDHLFNARGYFVEFGADAQAPAFFSGSPRERWRLKEVVQPSESLQVFATSDSASWIMQLAGPDATAPSILAENIIALVVLPERAVSDVGPPAPPPLDFAYDSRDATSTLTFAQLPPRVRVLLAAIDEGSAQRLAARSGTGAPALVPKTLFQDASQLDADIATLDASLTAAGIRHRFFQRDLELIASAWSDNP